MKKTNDFGRDSVPLLVLKTSVPFMLAQLVNVLYSIVDRIYVGNIPVIGADSLAGAGVCAPIITLLSSFGTLVGIGGSVLFSVRLGAGDERSARRILANSFSLLLILSAALTIVFLLTKDTLLNWFGASEVTFPYANTYLTIYTLGTFFALLSMGMNYFITAQGFPGLGMLTTLIGAVINIVLDPVFIFLFRMNIAGAAVGDGDCSDGILHLCALHTAEKEDEDSAVHCAAGGGENCKADFCSGFFPVSDSCDGQCDYHSDERGAAVLRRKRKRRYADYGGNYRPELYASDYFSDAGNYRRFSAADQL